MHLNEADDISDNISEILEEKKAVALIGAAAFWIFCL